MQMGNCLHFLASNRAPSYSRVEWLLGNWDKYQRNFSIFIVCATEESRLSTNAALDSIFDADEPESPQTLDGAISSLLDDPAWNNGAFRSGSLRPHVRLYKS